jgi:hypothetical protein
MKHVRLMRAEQLTVQQRLCRLELTGDQGTNGKTVRFPSTSASGYECCLSRS